MNWVVTSIRRKVPASIELTFILAIVCFSFRLGASDYQYFDLPDSDSIKIPKAKIPFDQRLKFKGESRRIDPPRVDADEYLFVKQSYLSEKRDQAIKLLRQEIDAGYKRNRDNMLLRLGQLYTEKYMELSYYENEVYAKKMEEYESKKGKKRGRRPRLNNKRSNRYLRKALNIFTKLEREYPKHPKLDEVLFFLGFVNMEFGRTTKGSGYLNKLISRYPRSRKYREAILYLADYYFEKRRYRDALKKYQVLLRRKDNELYFYALYKSAWSRLNLGQKSQALNDMKSLTEALKDNQDTANFNLREQALQDLVTFFAEMEQVEPAVEFFEENVGKEKMLQNLEVMANLWQANASDEVAIQAYMKLLEEKGDSIDVPKWQLSIYDGWSRLGQTAKAVEALVQALDNYHPDSKWAKNISSEQEALLKERLADLEAKAKNSAFFYHQTAQKTKNKSYWTYALQLYRKLVERFPDTKDKRKLVFYQGEILYGQGKWIEAADIYMSIAKSPPNDKLAEEAGYNALLALDNLTANNQKLKRFSKEELRNLKIEKQEIPAGEKRFIEVAEFYLKKHPKSKKSVDVRYRIAGIYYRYGHYDEAIKRFKEIALTHPRHKSAPTAAGIVLDMYNIRKDYKALDETAKVFLAKKGLGNRKFKNEIKRIRAEIGFKEIENLEANNRWKEAGEAYYQFHKANPRGILAEKSLYNAVVSFEKAKDAKKLDEVSQLFIRKYPRSSNTKRLRLNLAVSAEKQFEFKAAGDRYRDYYRKYPKDSEAKKSLYNAAVYAELNGENRTALSRYREYVKLPGVSRREKKAIKLSQAAIYKRQGNWRQEARIYEDLSKSAATLEEKINLLGKLSDIYRARRRITQSNQLIDRIYRLTRFQKNPRVFGSGLTYVAHSRFRALQAERKKYDRLRLRFPASRFVADLKRKQNALVKLSDKYDQLVTLGEPEWGVAAIYAKSTAYSEFGKVFRKTKIPLRYKGAERKQITADLQTLEKTVVIPIESRSQEFIQACAAKAAEFFVASDYANKCFAARPAVEQAKAPSGILPQPSYWTTRWIK